MKHILITGGSGFLGQNLIKRILERNLYSVTMVCRKPEQTVPEGVSKVIYDGSFESLDGQLKGQNVDAVIHLATHFCSQHKSEEIAALLSSNITLGAHILEWASKNRCNRVLNAGTYAQFVDGESEYAQNLYAATKTAFEKILDFYTEAFSFKTTSLYLYDTYGPKDSRPKLINLILNAMSKGERLNMSPGMQEICYVYVDDVVSAFLSCLEHSERVTPGKPEHYCVYSEDVLTVRQLTDLAQSVTQQSFSPNFGFYPYRAREIMKFKPKYPRLPEWIPGTDLRKGIEILWLGMNNEN